MKVFFVYSIDMKRDINVIEARQQTAVPSSTLSYAYVCSDTPRYSRACSCLGVTPTTTALKVPQKTTTVTVTKIVTEDYRLPLFHVHEWGDGACTLKTANQPLKLTFVLGECVNLVEAVGIRFEVFSAGSCNTTVLIAASSIHTTLIAAATVSDNPFHLKGVKK